MSHGISRYRGTMRAAAVAGAVAASVLAVAGCSGSRNGDAPAKPTSLQVREVAVVVAMSQWSEQTHDVSVARQVLADTGLDEFLTPQEYVDLAAAGCPAESLPTHQAGWVCDAAEADAYLVFPAELTSAEVATADYGPSLGGGWEVHVQPTDSGEQLFATLTARASSREPQGAIAFMIDGQVVSAPVPWETITGGSWTLAGGLMGEWSEDEAKALAANVVG